MAARLTAATRVIAVDPDPRRLALARRLGATHAVNPCEDDALCAVRDLTCGRGAERALETSGVPKVLRQAVD
ncbi:zinc-binding dehydrogenase, partial [Streptomyces niveiscabiei]